MKLHKLKLSDRGLFEKFLGLRGHELSVYAFANIYIWSGIFTIEWEVIDGNLCVFFRDKTGCFLYFTPLGETLSPEALLGSFRVMDGCNKNPAVSRVENIEAADRERVEALGYRIRSKPGEYLCLRKTLAGLKGDAFKSKRASVNYFGKHYESRYLEFSSPRKAECLKLYGLWERERSNSKIDPVYRGMLKDGLACLKSALADHAKLGLVARIVEVEGKVKGFTAGFELNPETFCVLYEFADLSVKGLSQYIFMRFCRELERYDYINIMDDSGLENLKLVKESYRPSRLVPAFIADRENG